MRTGKVVVPSGFYVYDQINGGQDQGAIIVDSQETMMSQGAPPASSYTGCKFRPNQGPSGVPYYKEDVAVNITDSVDAATAIMLGWMPQMPINVTGSFERFTSDGVAWGGVAPRGGSSNHSIYLAGIKFVGSTPYFILVNSWGEKWGPWQNGCCLIPTEAIDNPAVTDDAWCHVSIVDPDDKPPIPTN